MTTIAEQTALLETREPYYERGLTIENAVMFCSDERESDDDTPYIHVFGGGLNTVYTFAALKETLQPGSTSTTFAEDTATGMSALKNNAGARPGVHSATEIEGGKTILRSHPECKDVDCGYAKMRQAISQLIVARGTEIITDAKQLRPELFETDDDTAFAHDVVAGHGRLAESSTYFSTGREVLNAAQDAGAETMVVNGEHSGKAGIINLVAGSSLNSTKASQDGKPTYEHDGWATAEVAERLQAQYPYTARQVAIAELIDAIGTMRALGVETIAVRRLATVQNVVL